MAIIITDCCECLPDDCPEAKKRKEIEERALGSINKVYTTDGRTYEPDGTGMVTLPIPSLEDVQAVQGIGEQIDALKQADIELTEDISTLAGKTTTAEGEIAQLKTETQGLAESVVSDAVLIFEEASRTLKLSIEREAAEAIDASVVIPAGTGGGTGGKIYTAGDGISISADDVISAAVDGETVKLVNGKLTATGGSGGSGGISAVSTTRLAYGESLYTKLAEIGAGKLVRLAMTLKTYWIKYSNGTQSSGTINSSIDLLGLINAPADDRIELSIVSANRSIFTSASDKASLVSAYVDKAMPALYVREFRLEDSPLPDTPTTTALIISQTDEEAFNDNFQIYISVIS